MRNLTLFYFIGSDLKSFIIREVEPTEESAFNELINEYRSKNSLDITNKNKIFRDLRQNLHSRKKRQLHQMNTPDCKRILEGCKVILEGEFEKSFYKFCF